MKGESKDVEVPKTDISAQLINALTKHYKPVDSFADADETKSTQDLIIEMGSIDEIYPYEVNRLMQEAGFKLHYTGSGFVWLLKQI